MPTSYSTLLGLALPVTGELSGTWGDEVNNYITQYLDSAVAGTQTISGSQTAVTLSKTTNASLSQAGSGATGSSQYQIINCTGNPGGLLTITAPAASKAYLILNNTSTNQSVKIVGSGPTTGVTVAATRCALVAWNGSDFELVASTDASQLTGVLAVANGGTGATTLTGYVYGNGTSAFTASTSIPNSATTATSANTASAIVARDGSGNFSAGTITATLSGTATQVSNNLTLATSGTGLSGSATFNGSSAQTFTVASNATSANTASTIVARDASGNFSAGTITGTLSGNATNVSGVVAVANGGTGLSSTPANGALDIGNGSGFTRATLTAGSGVSISNGAGSITISATGSGGTVTSVGATAPVASSGGNTPTISLNSAYGDTLNPYGSKTANFFLAAPNGSAGAPTFRAIVAADVPTLNQNTTGTASNVTGIVAVANGGTGATDAATARSNLGAGTVTSVSGTGTVQGLTLSGSVTSSGSLTLGGSLSAVSLTTQVSGTLPVANGGTGATTLTANNVLLGNGTSALQVVAPGSSGNVLTSDGTTWTSAAPAATGGTTKTWTSFTSTGTYTVPTGVTSIRVYAFGAGGSAAVEYDSSTPWYYMASGAGGGCAYGDLAVTPGTTVTITISSGNATVSYASVTRFTANKGATASTPFSSPNAAAGGTASIGTGVTNGNAYTGGNGSTGSIGVATGGSSASPLGNGTDARSYGGAGWGTGNGGDPVTTSGYNGPTPSGGAGGAANTTLNIPGVGRGGYLVYSDPLLASLTAPGVSGYVDNTNGGPFAYGATGGPGAGGGGVSNRRNASYTLTAGPGGFGGGGGSAYNNSGSSNGLITGAGGFGASAGAGFNVYFTGSQPQVGASGFGAGASLGTVGSYGSGSANSVNTGTAGAAIVLIYA